MLSFAMAGVIDSSSVDDSDDIAPSIPIISAPEPYMEAKPHPQVIKIIRMPPAMYNPMAPMTRIIHVVNPGKPSNIYNSKFFQHSSESSSSSSSPSGGFIRLLRIQRPMGPAPMQMPMRLVKFVDNNNLW